MPADQSPDQPQTLTRLGHFIEKYSSFLSSFVIGLAGLIATSIWQYRQSESSRVEAETQRRMAQTKADNDWRIARAEILAKNLDVLGLQGAGAADRKFGVLLSLTRGNILDPELAVSYALELGKENAYYMRSVLASTPNKNYTQLAQAFALTCIQRFGVEREVDLCKDDKLGERSDAIAGLIADELDAGWGATGTPREGPLSLVLREEDVQAIPSKLAWLFEPYLQDLYEHKRWTDIARFENVSRGAKLVSALVLATARTGELLAQQESKQLGEFHGQRRHWLADYLFGTSCDGDCRAHLVEFMLSTVQESEGDYNEVLAQILTRPRAEVARAFNHLHGRILWCQIDPDDLALLRDDVILPTAAKLLVPGAHDATRTDLVDLVALVDAPVEAKARAQYEHVMAAIRADPELLKLYSARLASTQRQRTSPPPSLRKGNFCAGKATERGGF